MSTPIAELCFILVEDAFGELAAQVFETLCLHGRLSLHALIVHSKLPPRQVRHALVILCQQNMVAWTSDNNDNYEANIPVAYNLVRYARLLRVVEDEVGEIGQRVASVLLRTGSARIKELVKAIQDENLEAERTDEEEKEEEEEAQSEDRHQAKTEPSTTTSPASADLANEIRATALFLIKVGLATPVHYSQCHPPADNRTESTIVQRRSHGSDKVKRAEEKRFNADIESRLIQWRYNEVEREDLLGRTDAIGARVGQKRKSMTNGHAEEPPAKRSAANRAGSSDMSKRVTWKHARERDLAHLDDTLIKLNFDKLSVYIRNQRLAELAFERIGRATSVIYGELLNQLSQPLLRCKDRSYLRSPQDEDGETPDDEDIDRHYIALTEVVRKVDLSNVDTRFGLPRKHDKKSAKAIQNGSSNRVADDDEEDDDDDDKRTTTNGHVKEEEEDQPRSIKSRKQKKQSKAVVTVDVEDDEEDDFKDSRNDSKETTVKQHLLVLKEYPPQLARELPATHLRAESWNVDYTKLSHCLCLNMIDDIIEAKFGRLAMRLVRILREKGKLEQKHLSNFSLMNHKTQLALLTALQKSGYLDLQEVPKDSTRTPGKTIFLWFFDEKRCAIKMLEDTYGAMKRLLQRVRLESERFRNVIEKSQRSDVQGKEDEFLTTHEKEQLAKWHDVETRFLVQVERLDDVVFALKDF